MKNAVFPRLSIAIALLFGLWASTAQANDYDDVNLLLRQGKSNERWPRPTPTSPASRAIRRCASCAA